MAQDYQVVAYEGQKAWEGKYGSMLTHYVQLAGVEGTVEINQKPETASPMPGSSIYGSLTTETKTRKSDGEQFTVTKLKKEQRPDGVPVPQQVSNVPNQGNVVPPSTTAGVGPGVVVPSTTAPQQPPTPTPPAPPAAPQTASQSVTQGDNRDRSIIRQVMFKVAGELHSRELADGEMAMPQRVVEIADALEAGFYGNADDLPSF